MVLPVSYVLQIIPLNLYKDNHYLAGRLSVQNKEAILGHLQPEIEGGSQGCSAFILESIDHHMQFPGRYDPAK